MIIKWEETALRHSLILRFLQAGLPFWIEVKAGEQAAVL
ncbi:hypothetical protein LEMLEM_LOCUS25013 [Lemmus lemmus]